MSVTYPLIPRSLAGASISAPATPGGALRGHGRLRCLGRGSLRGCRLGGRRSATTPTRCRLRLGLRLGLGLGCVAAVEVVVEVAALGAGLGLAGGLGLRVLAGRLFLLVEDGVDGGVLLLQRPELTRVVLELLLE